MVDAAQVYRDPVDARMAQAIQGGDVETLSELIADGADVNAAGEHGVVLLQWAMLHKQLDAMDVLLRAGADTAKPDAAGASSMHYAAQAEDPAYMELLLARGGEIEARRLDTEQTPLHTAVLCGRADQVLALLEANASLDARDVTGGTPLHTAAKTSDAAACLLLLERGADPAAVDARGATFVRYLEQMDDDMRPPPARAAMAAIRALVAGSTPPPLRRHAGRG